MKDATPRPWVTFEGGSSFSDERVYGICKEGKSTEAILGIEPPVIMGAIGDDDGYYEGHENLKADFAFIVRAVNSHDRAIELLKAARDFIQDNDLQEHTVAYDMTRCDGECLANDISSLLETMEQKS